MQIFHHLVTRNKVTKKPIDEAPDWSYEEVQKYFEATKTTWDASESFKKLEHCIRLANLPGPITKVVAFALGSMQDNDHGETPEFSAYQHALLLNLKKFLCQKEEISGRLFCYAQDPAYGAVDRSILQESGVTVVDDPQGFLEVDEETVVISCRPNIPVKQIIADTALPAMMIWDKVTAEKVEGLW